MKNVKASKLTLNKETLRSINVSSAIRAGVIKTQSVTCKCGSVEICDSIDLCGNTINSAC